MKAPASSKPSTPTKHALDLQRMWAGEFGQAYTTRNNQEGEHCGAYHHNLCQRLRVRRVLEVGCNLGLNLTKIDRDPQMTGFGIDINTHALTLAKERMENSRWSTACAYQLPFLDGSFELVFTCGVLIHLPPSDLPKALREIGRVTSRYIWCGEYAASEPTEVPYRGADGALFKCDFGGLIRQSNPQLSQIDRGFLAKGETPFDDLTWWLFERADS